MAELQNKIALLEVRLSALFDDPQCRVDPEQLAGYALVYGRDPIYVLYGREDLGGVSPGW